MILILREENVDYLMVRVPLSDWNYAKNKLSEVGSLDAKPCWWCPDIGLTAIWPPLPKGSQLVLRFSDGTEMLQK